MKQLEKTLQELQERFDLGDKSVVDRFIELQLEYKQLTGNFYGRQKIEMRCYGAEDINLNGNH